MRTPRTARGREHRRGHGARQQRADRAGDSSRAESEACSRSRSGSASRGSGARRQARGRRMCAAAPSRSRITVWAAACWPRPSSSTSRKWPFSASARCSGAFASSRRKAASRSRALDVLSHADHRSSGAGRLPGERLSRPRRRDAWSTGRRIGRRHALVTSRRSAHGRAGRRRPVEAGRPRATDRLPRRANTRP